MWGRVKVKPCPAQRSRQEGTCWTHSTLTCSIGPCLLLPPARPGSRPLHGRLAPARAASGSSKKSKSSNSASVPDWAGHRHPPNALCPLLGISTSPTPTASGPTSRTLTSILIRHNLQHSTSLCYLGTRYPNYLELDQTNNKPSQRDSNHLAY